MGQYTSYYTYQRYERRGSQDWIPCYPNTYSISGDSSNPMTLVMKEENDPQCGYAPPSEPQYRWNVVDGFLCANCDTTKAMIHTSADTIYISGSGEITQAEVSGYASVATDVVITTDARAIGNNAFSGFSGVEFVRIPNSVTSIGDKAFYGCSAMTECQIPYGIYSIGNSAFTNSISLMFVDIPNSVTTLGNGCFKNCLNFFYNCDGLSDIEIPSSISGIGDSAFAECSGLYSVTVNATTPPTLGTSVFINTNTNLKIYVPCESLNTYKSASGWSTYSSKIVPNDCGEPTGATRFYAEYSNGKKYYEYCRGYDTALTTATTRPYGFDYTSMISAEVGDCILGIYQHAFDGCTNLTSIDIPNSVTSIGSSVFQNCSSLTSIDIPNSVTSIGSSAFRGCGLTSITIPNSVTSIYSDAFIYSYNLKNVRIGTGVTSTGFESFRGCTGLTSVTFEEGSQLTAITSYNFSGCTSLASINVPSTVTEFGEHAFSYCSSLPSINIPDGVTRIGYYTFTFCGSLTSVVIPSSVTTIRARAFYGCTSLTSITCLATTPPTLQADGSTYGFFDITNDCPIYVPAESVQTYKSARNWSAYADRIQAIT